MPSSMQSEPEDHGPQRTLPLEGGWLALPFVAALGGAWAFSRSPLSESLTPLAVALALVVGGWQVFWLTLMRTDWATPLAQWQGWHEADALPTWPYLQSSTPGAYLHHRLAVALTVALLLGAALGRNALLLSLCFITLTQLALLWHEGRGEGGGLWEGLTLIGLPWMLGATLAEGDIAWPAVSGLVLALTVSIFAQRSWRALLGPALGATYLIWQGQEMAAGWLLLLALPGLIVLTQEPGPDGYRHAVGPWAIGMVILMAWVS
jgi:hypothetical protein